MAQMFTPMGGGWTEVKDPLGRPIGWVDPNGSYYGKEGSMGEGADFTGRGQTQTVQGPPQEYLDAQQAAAEGRAAKPIAPADAPAWEGRPEDNPYGPRIGVDDRLWQNIYQPTAYEYGGRHGMDQEEIARYQGLAAAADARQAPQMSQNIYGQQYGQDRGLELLARQQQQQGLAYQQQGLGHLQGLIDGTGPSVAQQQMNMGLSSAMAQQQSIAASARGGVANAAMAQRAAANAAANLSGHAVQQGGLLRPGVHERDQRVRTAGRCLWTAGRSYARPGPATRRIEWADGGTASRAADAAAVSERRTKSRL